MKKFMTLFTALFTFVLTSFGQNVINETEFQLIVDGVTSTEFLVTYNPQDQFNFYGAGVLLIQFDNPLGSIDFQCDDVVDVMGMRDYYTEPQLGVGINMIRVDYNMLKPGIVNIVATSFDEDIYLITKFHALDTLNSWNDGMKIGIEWGLKEGVASVDTMMYFNMGVQSVPAPTVDPDVIFQEGVEHGMASVDTMKYYKMGIESIDTEAYYKSGIASVNTDSIYMVGVSSVIIPMCDFVEEDTISAYYNGQLSVNTDSLDIFYDIGFVDGQTKSAKTTTGMKSATTSIGLNVYPNPVNKGNDINISCDNFYKVDVYDLSGRKVIADLNSSFVPTYDLATGMYVLVVWDNNNNTEISKVLVK